MANVYFNAMWGDIAMLINTIDTDRGRDVSVQSPSLGDQHVLSDRGQRLRTTTCEILFCDQSGLEPFLERYDAFCKLVEDGEALLFSHPLDGVYRARVSDVRVNADSNELCVKITCTFLREGEVKRVFPAEAGSSGIAGLESVTTAATATQAELDALTDVPGTNAAADALTVPATCTTQVTAWSEADQLDSQQVFVDVATLTKQIDDAIAALALTSDLSRWSAYRQMIMLRYAVVRAAGAFTVGARAMFDLYVETPRPLIAICAEVYGGVLAIERAQQVAKINRVRTPGLVPAGTTLKMPALELSS